MCTTERGRHLERKELEWMRGWGRSAIPCAAHPFAHLNSVDCVWCWWMILMGEHYTLTQCMADLQPTTILCTWQTVFKCYPLIIGYRSYLVCTLAGGFNVASQTFLPRPPTILIVQTKVRCALIHLDVNCTWIIIMDRQIGTPMIAEHALVDITCIVYK